MIVGTLSLIYSYVVVNFMPGTRPTAPLPPKPQVQQPVEK